MKLAVTAQIWPRDTCETCCLQTLLGEDKSLTVRSQCVTQALPRQGGQSVDASHTPNPLLLAEVVCSTKHTNTISVI